MPTDEIAFTEEHTVFREGFRRFLAAEVLPDVQEWRAAGAVARTAFTAAADNGFLGISAPEEAGGAGVDDPLFGLVMVEECARAGVLGFGILLVSHAYVAVPAVAALENAAVRDAWLPALVEGRTIASVAARASDGRTLRDVPGIGTADLVVGRTADGVLVVPVAGHAVDRIPDPLGLEEAGLGDLTLDERAGAEVVLGDAAAARALASDWLLWLATVDLAAAQAAIASTVAYVSERRVFGRPLSGFENTRVELARCRAEADAVSALEHLLLDSRSSGTLPVERTAALRIAASALHARAVDQGLQLHGGYGYMREYPIARAYADAGLIALLTRLEPEGFVADAMGLPTHDTAPAAR